MQHYSEHRIRLTGTPKELEKIKSIWGPETVEVIRQILRLTPRGQMYQIYLFEEHILANLEYFPDQKYTMKPKSSGLREASTNQYFSNPSFFTKAHNVKKNVFDI